MKTAPFMTEEVVSDAALDIPPVEDPSPDVVDDPLDADGSLCPLIIARRDP